MPVVGSAAGKDVTQILNSKTNPIAASALSPQEQLEMFWSLVNDCQGDNDVLTKLMNKRFMCTEDARAVSRAYNNTLLKISRACNQGGMGGSQDEMIGYMDHILSLGQDYVQSVINTPRNLKQRCWEDHPELWEKKKKRKSKKGFWRDAMSYVMMEKFGIDIDSENK